MSLPTETCCVNAARQPANPTSPHLPKRRKASSHTAPLVTEQADVLAILLGQTAALSQLLAWLNAGSADAPPVVVDETMVEVVALSALTAKHHPVLQHLYRQGVFDHSGWQQITATRPELAATGMLLLGLMKWH